MLPAFHMPDATSASTSSHQLHYQHEQQLGFQQYADPQQLQSNHRTAAEQSSCETWVVPPTGSRKGAHDTNRPTTSPEMSQAQNDVSNCGDTKVNDDSKGPISILQEYVQCSRGFRAPSGRSVLQWKLDERLTKIPHASALEFRATVSFFLDGLPHHAAGRWCQSKLVAKRDAAERSLRLFVTCWGEELLKPSYQLSEGEFGELIEFKSSRVAQEVEILDKFCSSKGYAQPVWHISRDDGLCQALAEIRLMDVPHHFAGGRWENEDEAKADAASRILWYLQCPGFEDCFELDLGPEPELLSPPQDWFSCEALKEEVNPGADRKTLLIRAQNRLQQMFAKELKPGQSVWQWTYETNKKWHRATVYIPLAHESITGCWARGQKEAQIDACGYVTKFLDEREVSVKVKSDRRKSAPSLRARH